MRRVEGGLRGDGEGRAACFVSWACYLDDSNGASVASRAMLRAIAKRGWRVRALSGVALSSGEEVELDPWLDRRAPGFEETGGEVVSVGLGGLQTGLPRHLRGTAEGVPVTLYRGSTKPRGPDVEEQAAFLRLFGAMLEECRPDVLIGYGGGAMERAVFEEAKRRGIATVFHLHNFLYDRPEPFQNVDAVLVPSRFAADYYREALGLQCAVIPNPVDEDRVRCERREPKFVTFVNPSIEKGVYAFARIADELGRRRPEIPLLVVEGRGTEATVASCGIDLAARGNVRFMPNTDDPKRFWRLTRLCLLPSLWWENQPLAAVEAMVNGIPVIGSDRGGIPETLGASGILLPLPDRLTPATRLLPTAEEVAPWVEAVIRLWDDPAAREERGRASATEAERWATEIVASKSSEFFENLLREASARRDRTDQVRAARPGPRSIKAPPGRRRAVVCVPHLNGIEWECERGLRGLEDEGVRVVRRRGSSAIDMARNRMASEAVHDGLESLVFIDADIGFEPLDALRLLARPEPVVAGLYAKKGERALASALDPEIREVVFGAGSFGLYPLNYAAAGFLRIKVAVLRRMIDALELPLCDTNWGRGVWPFFQPMIVPSPEGGHHYLGEDWAFSHRLRGLGITPMADASIRLWHFGRYGFGWEDAGADPRRHRSYTYRVGPGTVGESVPHKNR